MMSETWRPRKLDELGFVGRGKSRHRPRNAPELYGGPYPFIQTADIMASEMYIYSYSKTYSELGLAQSKMWNKGTLCMTIAGENTAETAILGIDACFPDSVVAFIADPELSDVRFVKYYLDTMKSSFKSVSRGATQDNLSLDKLLSFDLIVPDVNLQRRIADILSAYDDLIENNTRRIRVLEGMAQALYQEWFGKVDRESLPKGWELVKLGDVADIQWGDTSVTKASYVAEGFTAYSASGADGKLDYYDFDRKGIVLSAIGANCGKTWFAVGKWSCIKNTIRFWSSSNRVSTEYLYFITADENFWTKRGAAQPFISQGDARNTFIVCPDKETMDNFTNFASGTLEEINLLEKKNVNLRQTRDLLLPRLVSGEIKIQLAA